MTLNEEIKQILNHAERAYQLKNKKVLITGASSGIGLATATLLAKAGCELFLIARREEKLKEIQNYFSKLFPKAKTHILTLDIKSKNCSKELEKHGFASVDIFINNAGLAKGKDFVIELKDEDIEDMIETNNTAAFKLSSFVAAKMVKQGSGHIVHLGSIAGHFTYEGGSVYCATKFAMGAFSQALRQELFDKNIRVSIVSPGMVRTEFSLVRFTGDAARADSVYKDINCLESADVAQVIIDILKKPEHVNLDEIVILPQVQAPGTGKIKKN